MVGSWVSSFPSIKDYSLDSPSSNACIRRIGFLLGVWVSSVAMNVVRGAVNTLVVCMADSPATLQENHPVLAKEIEESWKCVLPEAKVTQPALRAIVV